MKTREELKREARRTRPPMGVFVIRNKASGRVQVRASRNLPGAMNRARFELTYGTRPSGGEMLEDWRALGAAGFEIAILDELEPKDEPGWDPDRDLEELEALWQARLTAGGATHYGRASRPGSGGGAT